MNTVSDDILAIISSEMNEQNSLLARKIQIILSVGALIMENSGDTDRIIRSMKRAAYYVGLPEESLNIHITYTTIMLSVGVGDYHMTKMLKCTTHKVDMTVITRVSKLLWRCIEENYSLSRFEREFKQITEHHHKYSVLITTLGAGVACGGFAMLFGADLLACLFTAVAATVGFICRRECTKHHLNGYMGIALASFVAVVVAYLTHFIPGSVTPWHPVLACTLFIVPGVPLINSVEDLLNNYIISGTTRGINAMLMVAGMTFGIVFAIKLFNVQNFTTLPVKIEDTPEIAVIAAFISAAGFSTIFNVPPRLLWVVGLGGSMAVLTRNFIMEYLNWGMPVGTLCGAFLISFIAVKAIHWFHVPSHVIIIPSVIPLIPGLLIYRLLFNLIDIDHLEIDKFVQAFQGGITATLVILAIVVGAAIPNIIARHYIERTNAQRLDLALRRRAELRAMQRYS